MKEKVVSGLCLILFLLGMALCAIPVNAEGTVVTVVDPKDGDNNFIFTAGTAYAGYRFNATLWVSGYGTPPVFAWQVRLNYNQTLLTATRAWSAVGDLAYIFTGRSSINPTPAFSMGSVLVGDALLGGTGETPPPESAKLATIEFQVILAPPEGGKVSCNLDIDNADTYLLDDDMSEIYPVTKVNGYYEFTDVNSIFIFVDKPEVIIGSNVNISGFIVPENPNVDVTIYHRNKTDTSWAVLSTVKTVSLGKYYYLWTVSRIGTFELKSGWDTVNSSALEITVKFTSTISIALNPPNKVNALSNVTISGAITPTRNNANVTIYYNITTPWAQLATTKTNSNGQYSFNWTATKNTPNNNETLSFFSSWLGDNVSFGNISSTANLTVYRLNSTITVNANPLTLKFHQNTTISGTLTPAIANSRISILLRSRTALWVLPNALTNSSGGYSVTFNATRIGTWNTTAIWHGNKDVKNSSGTGPILTVTGTISSITINVQPSSAIIGADVIISGKINMTLMAAVELDYILPGQPQRYLLAVVYTNSTGHYVYVWKAGNITDVDAEGHVIWRWQSGTYTLRASWIGVPDVGVIGAESLNATLTVKAELTYDVNGDNRVDIRDIALAGLAFGSYPGHPRWNPQVDINQDDEVDIRDIVLIAKSFGKT